MDEIDNTFDGGDLYDMPRSSALLQSLIDAGKLTPAMIAEALGIHPHSAYRYITNGTELRFEQIKRILQRGGREVLQSFFIELFMHTPAQISFTPTSGMLDVNEDGQIDYFDALAAQAKAVQQLSIYMEHLSKQRGDISLEMLQKLMTLATDAKLKIDIGTNIAALLHSHKPERKKAKPLPTFDEGSDQYES